MAPSLSSEPTPFGSGGIASDLRELTHSALTAALCERHCQLGCFSQEETEAREASVIC